MQHVLQRTFPRGLGLQGTIAFTFRWFSRQLTQQDITMIKLALAFLLIAIVAGILGFSGLAGAAANIAMFLFAVALVIFVVLLVLGLTIYKKIT